MTEGNKSKVFGFVCFSSSEEASKAIEEMDGRIVVAKPLYVTLAQKKEDCEARLVSQYNVMQHTCKTCMIKQVIRPYLV